MYIVRCGPCTPDAQNSARCQNELWYAFADVAEAIRESCMSETVQIAILSVCTSSYKDIRCMPQYQARRTGNLLTG
jgi:hypothetical protein